MKKILLIIAGVILSAPIFVSAQTVTAQLSDTPLPQVSDSCVDLQYNMGYRSRDARTNGEVSDLQDFLNTEGYLSVEPTGYYGAATVTAVKKFQAAALGATARTSGYGAVGPKSRAKIKEITCRTADMITIPHPVPGTRITSLITASTAVDTPILQATILAPQDTQTQNIVTSCGEITKQGKYILGSDLMVNSSSSCINIHDISNIVLDCQNHTVTDNIGQGTLLFGINIKNVSNFKVSNCKIVSGIMTSGASPFPHVLNIENSKDGEMYNNTITGGNEIDVVGSSFVNIHDNAIAGELQVSKSNNVKIQKNNFIVADNDLFGKAALVYLSDGYSNSVISNILDGKSAGVFLRGSGDDTRADDGIVTNNESLDVIQGNTISNFWDCGIEPSGYLFDSKIISNNIKNTGFCAIGAWYGNSMKGDLIKDNVGDNVPRLLMFYRLQSLDLWKQKVVYFKDNTFENNKLINIKIPNANTPTPLNAGLISMFNMAETEAYSGVPNSMYVLGNNIFRNNDFSSKTPNSYILLAPSSMVVDGGGNNCPPTTGGNFPLVCNSDTIAPTVEFIGTPTLTLQYDSAGKESMLVGKVTVKVTAGSIPLSFSQDGSANSKSAYFNLYNSTIANSGGDMVGYDSPASIPAGSTVTFTTTMTHSTKTLFAGSYSMVPSGLQYWANGNWQSVPASLIVNSHSSNSVTIIGETSPYISGVSTICGIVAPGVCIISGTRFSPTSNQVTINGVTKVLPVSLAPTPNERQIYFSPADFGITTSGSYPVQVSTVEGASNRFYAQINVSTSTATAPTATITSGPTLQLSYDSYSKESLLTAQATISVTAGSSDLSIMKPNATSWTLSTYAYMGLGAIDTVGHGGQPVGSATVSLNASVSQVQDNGNYWIIPAGKSAQFNVTQSFNPNQMFAGAYHATPYLYNVVNYNVVNNPMSVNNILSSKDGNLVTIIGERAPYISSANQVTASGAYLDQIQVTGARFNSVSNQVMMNGVTKTVATGASDKGPVTWLKLSDFGITTSGVYSLQVSTSEGASNMISVNVTVPTTTTTPAPTVTLTASPNPVTLGQSTTFTWSSNATECHAPGNPQITPLPNSSITVSPSIIGEFFFTITCTGPGGSTTKTTSAVVAATTATSSPTIAITSPNGGETLTAGQTKRITWNSSSIDSVTIAYTVGAGFNPSGGFTGLIANNIPNTGYYDWNVNIPVGTQIKVRIFGNTVNSNGGTSSIIDDSDNFFTVASPLVMNAGTRSSQLASVIDAVSPIPVRVVASAQAWSYTWTRNLEVNSPYADDVSALQTALTKEGVYSGEVTGGFYAQTYVAVKAFQTKYGIESTGFVGTMTRAKLNELYK